MNEAALVVQTPATLHVPAGSLRIRPYKVVDGMRGPIYYFLKIGAKQGTVSERHLPTETARQVAMISINRSTKRFTLSWWPWQEPAQVVQDLPMDQLHTAVQDLLGAGFPGELIALAAASPNCAPQPRPALPAAPSTKPLDIESSVCIMEDVAQIPAEIPPETV